MSVLFDLLSNKAPVEMVANEAEVNPALLEEMLAAIGIQSRNEDTRYLSHQALAMVSDRRPELLYGRWDYVASLLKAKKSHPKYNAIYILANLAKADPENRFDGIFRDYFDLLDDESVVVACHTAANAAKIARARPDLRSRITHELTNEEHVHLEARRKELAKGYAIEALDSFVDVVEDKDEIVEFVTRQLESSSPKTRKLAKEFLRKLHDQTRGVRIDQPPASTGQRGSESPLGRSHGRGLGQTPADGRG